jgi:Flp pilus assembly protein TadG
MRNLLRLISRFRRDRRGNIAVIFAIACIPLISAIGGAADFSRAALYKSKLQGAADAASVGSVARSSPAYVAAGSMTADGAIPAGVTDATNIFNGNISGVTGYTLNSLTAAVTKTGSVVNSTVSFSADVPAVFLGIVGLNKMTVTGTSTATAKMPMFADFYLLLDNSPSMGVGATPTDVATMVSNTPDKCAFACHDLSSPKNSYYTLAKTLGVTTRIDVLRQATQNLMDTAQTSQTYSNQFRMAIYDFGASSDSIGLRALFSLSSNLSSAKTAAGNIDLMGVWGQNDKYTADKDTPFSTVLPQITKTIPSSGTGTAASPQKYLFFVSDGVADESNAAFKKTMISAAFGNIAPRCQSPLDANLCDALKQKNVKIAVLYTTYLNLPTNNWYMAWIDPFNKPPYGPSPNSEIAANMQSCASPGLYFEVSPSQGISQAMNALFQLLIADARISS